MEFSTWEPVYELVLADLGYDREGDERVRDRLAAWAEPFDADRLPAAGGEVAVVAPGPSLAGDLGRVDDADGVVAASSAADRLLATGRRPDLVVTDLDGTPATAAALSRAGTPVAVHAHGDNAPALDRWLPACDPANVLATTQAAPVGPVVNHGGFTDGDRAAFLADAFGADRLTFVGWDLDDPTVGPEKRAKLGWARRLLRWLAARRGRLFDL
ncbi:MAG: putative Rossmann fold enzyme [uncultured archaeon A07HB70]|nr:MAG: putative Rossmann fold enzyme [uncultured archaeon A07HB70]